MRALFEQSNEFKYRAATGKEYTVYFLKFWQTDDDARDYVVKYQIRSPEGDFVWYGRMSRERVREELKIAKDVFDTYPEGTLRERVEQDLKRMFVFIIKRGLDKGFEEPSTEFIFQKGAPITKRIWSE
ncbi:hypothetical protein JXB22_11125 [candidate division WOR-3 bacterium]|nr:hypothetical protein [candidate division WOR-3 bacterium]